MHPLRGTINLGFWMKLYALSDVHLRYEANRTLLQSIRPHPDDWLILCGDVGETLDHLRFSLETLGPKFARLLWVPGNHELWTMPSQEQSGPRGEAQYQQWVDLCRQYQVLTPEDPFVTWEGEGGPAILAPLFLLYDYSFAPDDVGPKRPSNGLWRKASCARTNGCCTRIRTPPSKRGVTPVATTPNEAFGASKRRAHRSHQPLPFAKRPGLHPACSEIHHLVRDSENRRLAPPLSRQGRRLRTPARSQHAVARRSAF